MAPIIIVGYLISALSGLVHLGSEVAGLDLSIAQDQAGKAKLATLVAPAPAKVALGVVSAPLTAAALSSQIIVPAVPLCPKLTAAMQDDALNLVELSWVTGRCRR